MMRKKDPVYISCPSGLSLNLNRIYMQVGCTYITEDSHYRVNPKQKKELVHVCLFVAVFLLLLLFLFLLLLLLLFLANIHSLSFNNFAFYSYCSCCCCSVVIISAGSDDYSVSGDSSRDAREAIPSTHLQASSSHSQPPSYESFH